MSSSLPEAFIVAVPEDCADRDAVVAQVERAGGIAVPPSQLTALIVDGASEVRQHVRSLADIIEATKPVEQSTFVLRLPPTEQENRAERFLNRQRSKIAEARARERESLLAHRLARRGSEATQADRIALAEAKRQRKANRRKANG